MSLADKCKNIATAFVIKITLSVAISALFSYLVADQIRVEEPPIRLVFFMACVWAPFWEEIMYRWVPLTLAQRIDAKFDLNILWPVILLSSTIFGLDHGEGAVSLLYQGLGGIIYCLLYLKNNNSILSTMVLHSVWNTLVIFIL